MANLAGRHLAHSLWESIGSWAGEENRMQGAPRMVGDGASKT